MKTNFMITVVFVVSIVLTSGCLFAPRDPEDPGEDGTPWIVPNMPNDVFLNLSSGFAAITNSNYERSLSDEFEFNARLTDWPEFTTWGKVEEVAFLERLKGEYTGERTIQFGDERGLFDDQNVEVAAAWFEGRYIISLERGDGSDPDTFAGIARFYFERGSTGWTMIRWEDRDIYSDEYSTSSFLRKTLQ